MNSLHAFKLLLLCWSLGQMSPHASPLREVSQLPNSPLGLLDMFPSVFKARHFGGSFLHCWSQGLGYLIWGMNPSLLRKKPWIPEILPDCGHYARGGDSGGTKLLPLPPVLMWPFYCLLWRSCLSHFPVLFRELFHVSCRPGVSVGGSELRIFLCHHVGLPPSP